MQIKVQILESCRRRGILGTGWELDEANEPSMLLAEALKWGPHILLEGSSKFHAVSQ